MNKHKHVITKHTHYNTCECGWTSWTPHQYALMAEAWERGFDAGAEFGQAFERNGGRPLNRFWTNPYREVSK